MFCDALLELKLVVNTDSDYGKMLKDSAEDYGKQASNDPEDYKGIAHAVQNMFRIQHMHQLEISVAANYPYLKQQHPMGKKDWFTVVHIPSVRYACKVYNAPQNNLNAADEVTFLYFGNWAGADMNAKTYLGFPFVHKQSAHKLE